MHHLAAVFPPLNRIRRLPVSRDQLILLMVAVNEIFLGIDIYLAHSISGTIVPNERIRYTDKFDDPNLPGEMKVTITIKKVSVGSELNIVQEGVPDVIPPEACYLLVSRRN